MKSTGGRETASDSSVSSSSGMPTDHTGQVAAYYDRVAGEWDKMLGAEANGAYLQQRWNAIAQALASTQGKDIAVELGVGTGVYLDRIAAMYRQVIAVDFSKSMVEMLRRRLQGNGPANVTVRQGDARSIGFIESNSVDVVYCVGLLDNVDQPQDVVAEAARILRPMGILIICTSNGTSPWFRLRDWVAGAQHFRTENYLTSADIAQMGGSSGLVIEHEAYWGTVPPTIKQGAISALLAAVEPLARYSIARLLLPGLVVRLRKTDPFYATD